MNTNQAAQPSLRARIRSAQWMERTQQGAHEDALDIKARSEFEDELDALSDRVRQAVERVKARVVSARAA